MVEFAEATGSSSLTHIPDPDGEIWDHFGVVEHRTYIFIDNDGTTSTVGYGSLEADIVDLIER